MTIERDDTYCRGDPDGIHCWLDMTAIGDTKRRYTCSQCMEKKEEELWLDSPQWPQSKSWRR